MPLTKIEANDFTVFENIEIPFNKGLNVLVGENGMGKTYIMKLAYAACQASKHDVSFSQKTTMLFRPDVLYGIYQNSIDMIRGEALLPTNVPGEFKKIQEICVPLWGIIVDTFDDNDLRALGRKRNISWLAKEFSTEAYRDVRVFLNQNFSKLPERLANSGKYGWNSLCLCPNCAAEYNYCSKKISSLYDQVMQMEVEPGSEETLDIGIEMPEGKARRIRYSPRHFMALKEAFKIFAYEK